LVRFGQISFYNTMMISAAHILYFHNSNLYSTITSVAHSAGLSSDPEFTEHAVDKNVDVALVLATDGYFDFVNNTDTGKSSTHV
jgi:hypothetical protein